ncbi:hypothetical protein AJ80_06904 [Polytolypa hystricis UAMH7299]|uniref:FAD/NAD(P)-binding domain-containing protein n=1 Tax=Polytolypa hystricis (strain UAMH7299) TaxID=1447883 RepID=A0A2B7XSK8_POLH7|nr:hypothetical protein AJ80_06904 [Polytolypa hystricis UAMH7299]
MPSAPGDSNGERATNHVNHGIINSECLITEEPLNTAAPIDVVCIGAGFSGLVTAIKFQEKKNINFKIYEKNAELGGTWLENRYPGCACDVPAHIYTYTFEPNPDFSQYYIGAEEIHRYLKAVAQKHKLEKYIQYNSKVISAIWNESDGVWNMEIEVSDGAGTHIFKRDANFLINASGLLNNWKWPQIPGLQSFSGHLSHSANWDAEHDFAGQTVAILGSGSSAIQIVPNLQPVVKHMKAFIRSPTWIAPSLGFVDPKNGGPKNFSYTEEEKKKFRDNPEEFLAYRKQIESDMNRTFDTFLKEGPKQKAAIEIFTMIMKERLGGDEKLSSTITPKWGVGCRRLTPGEGFLEALIKENVTVVSNEIARIEPEGIVTEDGILHKVDAIICATGFDTTYRPRFKLVGRKGMPLADLWEDMNDIEAYLAMAIPDFPNYFMFLGPNAPISNGTLIPVMEKQCDYMVEFAAKMQRQKIKAASVKQDVTHQLNIRHQKFLPRMVFTDPCRSWYKGGRADGKVIGIWPGSSLHYYEVISEPRYEDYEFTYHGHDPWSYLGDGWTQLEVDDKEQDHALDLAFYLMNPKQVLSMPKL